MLVKVNVQKGKSNFKPQYPLTHFKIVEGQFPYEIKSCRILFN